MQLSESFLILMIIISTVIFENALKRTIIASSTYRDQGHLAGSPEVQRTDLPPWSSIGEKIFRSR